MNIELDQNTIEGSYLLSAFTKENRFQTMEQFKAWFKSREKAKQFSVRRIPFKELDKWSFEKNTQNLIHKSGRFFRIEGIRVHTNFGPVKNWEQPVINQPEIGILGIITKKFGGVRYFLMQAKIEPGNINICQLSPTVQATKSNYTQVHKGKQPLFLEFFAEQSRAKVLLDRLQSEQGARFLKKRNRNIVVEIEEDIKLPDDFCWLTLEQIKQLLKIDNFVNMDARSVLSCLPFNGENISQTIHPESLRKDTIQIFNRSLSGFSKDLFVSMIDKENTLHEKSEIMSWFEKLKQKYNCYVESIPLKNVKNWRRSEDEIVHESKRFFSVIAVSVLAESREVPNWTQPMIKQASVGIIGFLAKRINGASLHFLVQAKVEAGYPEVVEMAPTVSFSDVEYRVKQKTAPPFAEFFTNAPSGKTRSSVLLSEEGGRFYHSQNRYVVVEIEPNKEIKIPENYMWMTLGQLLEFTQYDSYVNIEARSLLSCLKFL